MPPENRDEIGRLSRQELTFMACNALAIANKKPTVALVREQTIAIAGIKKGSDGDVQEDIKLWYQGLFALKRDATIGGLPERMATLFRETWRSAVDLAEEGLVAEREKLAKDREAALAEVDSARSLADSLRHQLEMANLEVDAREATIARLDGVVAQHKAEIVQLVAKIGAKDERIESLSAELARKVEEKAAAFIEFDGARKHALMQIEQARGEGRHWKDQWERRDKEARSAHSETDVYRNKASNLEAALAGTRGRLDVLQDSLAAEKERSVQLSAQLVAEQERTRRLDSELATVRIALEASNIRFEAAARDLSVARDAVVDALTRERQALKEADQIRGAISNFKSP